ncbi:MAG: N-acetyltransferase [Acidobacteria bacterium]|nr:N-acetyltransferase [Acidobacteriota bacterium]
MKGPLTIEKVATPAAVEEFIRFPFRLYRGDPHWVPPLLAERRRFLDRAKNPVFEYVEAELFLARRAGRVAGTIAAVRNDRYGEFHPAERHVGFFGLFECEDDPEAAAALFGAAAGWLRERGFSTLRGPTNLTTNDVLGLLVEGFADDPVLLMPYNPPYYAALFERHGLVKSVDLFAYEVREELCAGALDDAVRRIEERGRCTVRPVDLRRLADELQFVRACYNEAWKDNWGFVPWTDRELEFMAHELRPIADARLAFIGAVGGEPAGFSIGVPDANRALKLARGRLLPLGWLKVLWKIKVSGCARVRVLALGVLPRFRRTGLDAMLIHRTITNGIPLGYSRAEVGWILEGNDAMIRPLARIGAERSKVFRVYDAPI